MRAVFLVDTNVLVYAYDHSDEKKRQRAIDVIEQLGESGRGVLTAQVLAEFFVAVTGRIPSPLSSVEAEGSVSHYIRSWPVFPVTAWAVREAAQSSQRYQMHFWDALIWATAKFNQVPTILTEDFSDGRVIEGIRYVNPFVSSFSLASLKG